MIWFMICRDNSGLSVKSALAGELRVEAQGRSGCNGGHPGRMESCARYEQCRWRGELGAVL